MARSSYGFFPAPGTDYATGQEPELARRLARLGRALKLHLIGISGARSPQHSVEVGGFANDPHTRGQASDTPGIEGVPENVLRRFGLTRPFGGSAEADHIQLLGGGRGSPARNPRRPNTTSLADLWKQAGGKGNLAPIMAAIAEAESGGRVDAVGGPNSDGSYDYGLWQINSVHSQFDSNRLVSDPLYNAKAAVAVWRSQGLSAWTTYSSGAYRSFLSGGRDYLPTFGRTRPGGGTDDNADTDFAAYYGSDTATTENVGFLPGIPIPLPGIPDPLGAFKSAKALVKDTTAFLGWVVWLLNPRHILQAVEFLTGLLLMVIGIHTAIQAHRGSDATVGNAAKKVGKEAIAATPVGRTARVAKGARAGRQATRVAKRRGEFEQAYKRGKKGQSRKQATRAADKRFGKEPPF